MLKYGEKLTLKGVNLEIDVVGFYPAGQQRTMQVKENSYDIKLNGIPVSISETNLNALIVSADEETITDANGEIKRKRGRPPKEESIRGKDYR